MALGLLTQPNRHNRQPLNLVLGAMKITARIITFFLVFCPALTLADQWHFKPEIVKEEFIFGTIRIVKTRDTTENQSYPDFTITIYSSEKLVSRIKGVSFEHIFANDDKTIFVGLSNSGFPGTAFINLSSTGAINQLVTHFNFEPPYCEKSVSIARTWVHEKNPDLKFHYVILEDLDNYRSLRDISFLDCNGERVSWKAIYLEGLRKYVKKRDTHKAKYPEMYLTDKDLE